MTNVLHERLISHFDPHSPEAEAYRTLRTNLQFSMLDGELHTLVITSSGPGEGKSTTAANLAITLAQTGRAVLLCDCDLRRPSQHQIFGVPNTAGLTSLLLDARLSDTVQDTGIEHLRLMTSGPIPPNPSELLESKRMEQVVRELASTCDIVIFDTPPIGAVTDAALLASRVDGVVLVVSSGQTPRDQAKRAKALLDKVKARVLGVVINNARPGTRDQYHYFSEQ